VIARHLHDLPSRPGRGHPERVALTLDDEHRHRHGLELGEAALPRLSRAAWRLERKREAEDPDGAGRFRRPARDPCSERPTAGDERQALQLASRQPLDDGDPVGVELRRRGGGTPAGDAVGLLDQGDGDPRRAGGFRRGNEIGCLDAPTGTVAEDERSKRFVGRVEVRARRPVRRLDLERCHRADLASLSSLSRPGYPEAMVDDDSRTVEAESESVPEEQAEELTVQELRHHVPAEIRNVSFPVSVRGYDRHAVDAYVTRVNRVIAELEVSRSPQAAVRHALDRVGEQTIAILNEARESAEKIAEGAREEAEAHVAESKAHAADLVVSASAQADQDRAEGERIVATAKAEAEGIVSQARATAAKTLAEAREKAARRVEQSEAEIAAAEERAESRMRKLDTDTSAVWNERDILLGEIHGLADRLQQVASDAASRVEQQEEAESPAD
jgi:DivIVA domain-containing protein